MDPDEENFRTNFRMGGLSYRKAPGWSVVLRELFKCVNTNGKKLEDEYDVYLGMYKQTYKRSADTM